MRHLLGIVGFGTACGLAVACGGVSESDPESPSAMAGSPASAGAPSGGVGGAGTATGGVSDGSGGATTGGVSVGGAAALCQGTFGASQTLYSFGAKVGSSLSITADELELFFVEVDTSADTRTISVLKRRSKSAAFSAPTTVSELQATCAPENYPALDVSDDGLRMYFTCLDGPAPLRFATRASRSAAWVVAPEPIGTVGDSISVSGDELTAVGVRDLLTNPRPEVYVRSALGEDFGAGVSVSGVNEYFINPDLSFDGRTLFGSGRGTASSRLVFVPLDENLAATAAPSVAGMPVPPPAPNGGIVSDYTPTVTPDCRSIYFLRAVVESDGLYTLEYATR